MVKASRKNYCLTKVLNESEYIAVLSSHEEDLSNTSVDDSKNISLAEDIAFHDYTF